MGNEQSGGGGGRDGYRADYRRHPAAPTRRETAAEAAQRQERAAAYETKIRKQNFRKDPTIVKAENWKKYEEIGKEKEKEEKIAAQPAPWLREQGSVGFRVADGARIPNSYPSQQPVPNSSSSSSSSSSSASSSAYNTPPPSISLSPSSPPPVYPSNSLLGPAPSAPPASQSPSPPPSSIDESSDAYFYQQMVYLITKVNRMPLSSIQLIIRILSNLLKADSVPDGGKYRKLKLNSEKIQNEIVQVDGALELLFAAGFERETTSDGADSLVCRPETPLEVARIALDKLEEIHASKR